MPHKTPKGRGSESFHVGELVGIWGDQWAWRLHGGSSPFPITGPTHLFHLAVPDLYLLTVNQRSRKQNVSPSSMSRSSKVIEPKEGLWEPPMIYSWSVRSTGVSLALWLASEEGCGGGSCGRDHLPCAPTSVSRQICGSWAESRGTHIRRMAQRWGKPRRSHWEQNQAGISWNGPEWKDNSPLGRLPDPPGTSYTEKLLYYYYCYVFFLDKVNSQNMRCIHISKQMCKPLKNQTQWFFFFKSTMVFRTTLNVFLSISVTCKELAVLIQE